MSILIKGLEMPKKGTCIDIVILDDGTVVYYDESDKKIGEAVELPDHGDLIDRNMLIGGFADWYIQESPMYLGDNKVVAETIGDAMKAIEAAPVVIPAERSKDERTD